MAAPAVDLWTDLLTCLELRAVNDDAVAGEQATVSYETGNQQLTYHRIFGGQLLAQFVCVAGAASPGKSVKSLHALFPRAGQAAEPVRYDAQSLHDGSTFATLTITARQSAGAIAVAAVSMHAAEDGPDLQITLDVPSVPGPDSNVTIDLLPWETRSAADLNSPQSEPPEYELWMRVPPVSPEMSAAVAAYATDLTLIGTALRPLDGVSQQHAGKAFTSAVTSHTLWFHRPFRTGGWLLLRQHSPVLAHGRCFGRGDILTEDGSLVASFAQEAMLRFRHQPAR